MDQLAQTLQFGRTEAKEVQGTLEDLTHELSSLGELWATRRQRLEQGLELQRFNQVGDRIEATLSGHQVRLKVQDNGVRTLNSQRTKYQDFVTILEISGLDTD